MSNLMWDLIVAVCVIVAWAAWGIFLFRDRGPDPREYLADRDFFESQYEARQARKNK